MNVVSRKRLEKFWNQHADATHPLLFWYQTARRARWRSPADIKQRFADASFLKNDRVVFNIGGNKYRLVVGFKYRTMTVFIKFVGTHAEYNRIDAETVT